MRHLSNNDFEILSKKIVQLFPSEITESYFLRPTKKRDSFDNRPGVAKGKLVDKFRNKLTFLREAGILPTRNKENEIPIQEVFDTNPENQHILWLKHNRGPTDQVYHHWDASFSARRQQLLKDGGILEELRDQYPILKEPICLDLVETDFEKIFPNKSNHLIDSWESVITKLIKLRGYCVTAESDRILLDLLGAETLHDDYKHYVMLTLMASLLPNKSRHVYGRSRKQWKPTVVDSRNGIVIRAEADGSVGYLISTYRMECSTRGPRSYPRSLATISHSRQNPTPNSGLGIRFSLVCRHGWKRSGIMDIFNAKKMNVESLRANQQQKNETAELRIAKAALTICFLFVASWTPYAILSLIGAFGDQSLLTPGVSMIPALACKLVSCIDPYVYAISHPKYRIELQKRLPCLGINEASDDKSTATNTSLSQSTVT